MVQSPKQTTNISQPHHPTLTHQPIIMSPVVIRMDRKKRRIRVPTEGVGVQKEVSLQKAKDHLDYPPAGMRRNQLLMLLVSSMMMMKKQKMRRIEMRMRQTMMIKMTMMIRNDYLGVNPAGDGSVPFVHFTIHQKPSSV